MYKNLKNKNKNLQKIDELEEVMDNSLEIS